MTKNAFLKPEEKIKNYFSIDWLKLSNFMLLDCGYDGWGWEFLHSAVKKRDENYAIAFLYRKFNTRFNVPDPTEEVPEISPLYSILPHLKDAGLDNGFIHPIFNYASEKEILDFFESIDFIRIAKYFPRGICHPAYRLSHRRLIEWKIIRNDIDWFISVLPRKINV
jgi:hypothetical protein